MKLNEISPDLIDEMLKNHPIRGIINCNKIQKLTGVLSFHTFKGWYYFSKIDLKENKRFYKKEFENYPVKIEKTKQGFMYCKFTDNSIYFFKKMRNRNDMLVPFGISMDFSHGIIKSNHTGFLLSQGVKVFVRKYVIPFNKNGEMMIGSWQEKYFSAQEHKETSEC